MTVQLVGDSGWTYVDAPGATFTPTMPSGLEEGDFLALELQMVASASTPNFSSPAAEHWARGRNQTASNTVGVENAGTVTNTVTFSTKYGTVGTAAWTLTNSPAAIAYRVMAFRSSTGNRLDYDIAGTNDTGGDATISGTLFSLDCDVGTAIVISTLINQTTATWSGDPTASNASVTLGTPTWVDANTDFGSNMRSRSAVYEVTAGGGLNLGIAFSQAMAGSDANVRGAVLGYSIFEVTDLRWINAGAAATALTTFTPAIPLRALYEDLFVVLVWHKYEGVVVTPPSGWTLLTAAETTGFAEAALADTGDIGVKAYMAPITDVSSAWSVSGHDMVMHWAIAIRQPTLLHSFSVVGASTTDTDAGTTFDAALAGIDSEAEDLILGFAGANGDAIDFSAPTLSQAGSTLASHKTFSSSAQGTGTDAEAIYWIDEVTAGSSTATLNVSATVSSGTADLRMAGGALRIRALASFGPAASVFPALSTAAAGTYTPPGRTGTAASTFPALTQAVAGTTEPPTSTGTAASSFAAATQAAAGTHTAPTYTGTGASSFPALTVDAAGTHDAPVFTGSGASSFPAATTDATGTFRALRTATAASVFAAFTQDAAGTHAGPTFTGSATSAFPALGQAATGTVADPVDSGAGASVFPAFTSAASGTFVAPSGTGYASSVFPALTQDAAGTHSPPVYTAAAASAFPALSQSVAATHDDPDFTGTAASTFPSLTLAATGTVADPVYTGTGASTFAAFITVAEGPVTGPRAFELFAIAVIARHRVLELRRRHGEIGPDRRHGVADVDRRWGTLRAQTGTEITT